VTTWNRLWLRAAGAALCSTLSTTALAAVWSSGTVNIGIPDSNPIGITSTINVGETGALTDLTVTLAIDHTWVGDLLITLTNPLGTTVTLMDRPGVPADSTVGDSSNLSSTVPINFSDLFATPAEDAGNPDATCGTDDIIGVGCPGDFAPDGSLLATFGGAEVGGDWTLFISDNAGGDVGTLVTWQLDIGTAAVPVPGALWLLGSALFGLGVRRHR
jgi:subtilisin-like proprotein convertase family protein